MLAYQPRRLCKTTPGWKISQGLFSPKECSGLAPSIGPREVPWSDPNARWLFDRLSPPVASWNEEFGFELFGFETLRIAVYPEGPPTAWRTGFGAGKASEYKIGVLAALCTAAGGAVGRVEFFANEKQSHVVELGAGDAVVWPAWMQHRIRACAKGPLWTLEAWVLGPPFR